MANFRVWIRESLKKRTEASVTLIYFLLLYHYKNINFSHNDFFIVKNRLNYWSLIPFSAASFGDEASQVGKCPIETGHPSTFAQIGGDPLRRRGRSFASRAPATFGRIFTWQCQCAAATMQFRYICSGWHGEFRDGSQCSLIVLVISLPRAADVLLRQKSSMVDHFYD